MPTANDLIIQTQSLLSAYTTNVPQLTTLITTLGIGQLTFTVSDTFSGVLQASAGVVEIDDELLFVSGIDNQGVATVPPWGRGYLGTTAAAHAQYARVTSQPAFPRQKILDELNITIGRVFPDLYVEKAAAFTTSLPSMTYDLPDDAIRVLDARYQDYGAEMYWVAVRRLRINPSAGTTASSFITGPYTNVTVDIADAMPPGRPMVITYAAAPGYFATSSDDYSTAIGLDLSCRDVLVYGAAATLASGQELSRLQTSLIEEQNRSQLAPPGTALTASRFLEQKYQTRLVEEAESLRRKYPPRVIGTWT